jgi:hypothetical protein
MKITYKLQETISYHRNGIATDYVREWTGPRIIDETLIDKIATLHTEHRRTGEVDFVDHPCLIETQISDSYVVTWIATDSAKTKSLR